MKNKIAIASAFLAASSFSTAEIVINDFLSFEGFVDMSYATTDLDGAADANANSFQVDQVEISWLFDFDPVTAQIDFAHEGTDNAVNAANGVEQAFATYHLDNGSAVTAGRYASMLGFEAFEPTGLYQYSFAYNMNSVTGIGVGASALPGYYQGVKYTYETDTAFFGLSLADSLTGTGLNAFGGNGGSSFVVEAAGSVQAGEGVTLFLGGAVEDAATETYVINSYVTFETGAWLFAGELNYGDYEATIGTGTVFNGLAAATNEEIVQALLMANFAYSEQASVTGRLSYSDHSADAGNDADFLKYTLAHGYAFTDNLFLVNELSYVDGEINNGDYESLQAAVELIFSF